MNSNLQSGSKSVFPFTWGSHLTQFFGSADELREVLVPYFAAGLANNERCLWVTGWPFTADQARAALRHAVPDLDQRERTRQIEIANGEEWYSAAEKLQPHDLVAGLLKREQDALADGYEGLRTNGNCAWVSSSQWADFQSYELLVHEAIRGKRMICLCSYSHEQIDDASRAEILARHDNVVTSDLFRTSLRQSELISVPDAFVSLHRSQSTALNLRAVEIANSPLLEALRDVPQVVLDTLPIGVYACDASGRIVRVNRKAIELWGRTPKLLDDAQKFCGCFQLETLDRKKVLPHETPMARAVLRGERFEGVEAIVRNPDGKYWVARVEVAPLRNPNGDLVGAINCFQDVTHEHDMRTALERQQKTFDLAMVASRMGTWRYTFADNICVYDANAQSLYGLTQAHFLHDQDSVNDKFHPEDIERMWSRVAKALDPDGDGLYDVDYRVKQLDGSWRWLSAWGIVEFDGDGADKKPVAIAGASRDLTERKEAESLQQLLLNELTHRVKNTMATIQAIASQTLRAANDLPSAREALNRRIVSMAQAHDLLTSHNWNSANLMDIVKRAMMAFNPAQVKISGPALQVSARHTLSLSLALHELATNATKYGALSCIEGHVLILWRVDGETLRMDWIENAGPSVMSPTREGFGSQLIEIVARDLGGDAHVSYDPSGVRCRITAAL